MTSANYLDALHVSSRLSIPLPAKTIEYFDNDSGKRIKKIKITARHWWIYKITNQLRPATGSGPLVAGPKPQPLWSTQSCSHRCPQSRGLPRTLLHRSTNSLWKDSWAQTFMDDEWSIWLDHVKQMKKNKPINTASQTQFRIDAMHALRRWISA